MVVLYSTTARTVDREKPRSRMSLNVVDRWATKGGISKIWRSIPRRKLIEGDKTLTACGERLLETVTPLSRGIKLRRTKSHERRRDVTTPGWVV